MEVVDHPDAEDSLEKLIAEWNAKEIIRLEFNNRLLSLVDTENVDEIMRYKLPKGIRMYLYRDIVNYIDHGFPESPPEKDGGIDPGLEVVTEWAKANIEYAQRIAYPQFEDPSDVEGLLRLQSEHLIVFEDFDRIIRKILNSENVREKLAQFPYEKCRLLKRWAKTLPGRIESDRIELPDDIVREVGIWYANHGAEGFRRLREEIKREKEAQLQKKTD